MRRLNEFAKRIGAGDLGASLQIQQRDEIGELAAEMNQMSRACARRTTGCRRRGRRASARWSSCATPIA